MLKNKETGEIKEQQIFLGEYPIMTPWGTFVINGAERVIVTQIIRSAGVFFSSSVDKKSGQVMYAGQVIPTRGAWVEYETGTRNIWYAKLDRSKKIPLTTFLRAMGLNSNRDIINLYGRSQFLDNTFTKDETFGSDDALEQLYDKIRPGEKSTPEQARTYLAGRLFDNRRYDLASVGRYKVNKKLDVISRLESFVGTKTKLIVEEELVNNTTGEIILEKGNYSITAELCNILRNNRSSYRKKFTYDQMLEGNSVVLEILVVQNDQQKIKIIGNNQEETANHITLSDILSSVGYYMNLHVGIGSIDDIDHLGNRRLRLVGELLQNQFRIGLGKLEKNVRERMSISSDTRSIVPQNLINIRTLTASIREFFGSSQLSQFMDQINPLSELTHKRRLSALVSGGLTRYLAGFEVRDVHVSHYGRICPIETPEGQNIGLINSLATYARVDKYGFIETPYLKVIQNDGKTIVTNELVYLTADKEELHYIAQANINVSSEKAIEDEIVICRHMGETIETHRTNIDLLDVSPKQIVAVSTACIPFL